MTSDGQLENIMPTSSSQASATASYAWDPLGHMCWSAPSYVSSPSCGSVPQGATTYSYAGDGLRMSETPPGGAVVNFAYDTATGSTPRIIEDSTNVYIYGPGNLPVEQVPLSSLGSSTPTLDIIASDPTGMREIAAFQMTSSGPVLQGYETCSYTTYGTPSSSSSGSSPPSTPVGYENGYTDPTGLVYLINRYYDPSLRQFISVDPAYSTTHQLYGYVGENPVNGSDPSGEDWADIGNFIVAVVFSLSSVFPGVFTHQYAIPAPDTSTVCTKELEAEVRYVLPSETTNGQPLTSEGGAPPSEGQALAEMQSSMDQYGMGAAYDEALALSEDPYS